MTAVARNGLPAIALHDIILIQRYYGIRALRHDSDKKADLFAKLYRRQIQFIGIPWYPPAPQESQMFSYPIAEDADDLESLQDPDHQVVISCGCVDLLASSYIKA